MLGIQNISASRPYHAHNPRFGNSDGGSGDKSKPKQVFYLPGKDGGPPIRLSIEAVVTGPDGKPLVRLGVLKELIPGEKPPDVERLSEAEVAELEARRRDGTSNRREVELGVPNPSTGSSHMPAKKAGFRWSIPRSARRLCLNARVLLKAWLRGKKK